MPKRILIVVALVAAALAVPLWLARDPVVAVRVATATRGPLAMKVATNGTVEPIDDFEVRARLDGRVLEIREAGDSVAAGDIVVRIDPGPTAAALQASRSQRLEAEEALRAARDHLARTERTYALDSRLHRESALARERLVESESTLNEARARVGFLEQEVPLRLESLALKIEDLESQLDGTAVVAPITGTVYHATADAGEVVRRGHLLVALADLGRLQVRTNVDQVDLGKVRAGNPIEVFANAYPDRVWAGQITEIVPRVEMRENRAVAEAVAEIVAPVEGLVPGMNVDVEIVVRTAENVLQVPSEAIFAAGEGPFVYRVEAGRIVARPVTIGLSSFDAVEIARGIEADDVVVLGPAAALRDGMRITPRDDEADGGD
jgi:HlyD family secretion protein